MSDGFKNDKLFEYVVTELHSHGGDGGVLVVFKQQSVEHVALEFEKWEIEKYPTTPGLRMAKLESHTPGKVQFSDMSNENLIFVQWSSYHQFQLGEIYGSIPICEEDHRHWDTVIVTW